LENISLDVFEDDWQRQWLVERGIEIISEASRHLTDEIRNRHPEIPLAKSGWYRQCAMTTGTRRQHLM
jgi:uncharacterized protein with HEPN domain